MRNFNKLTDIEKKYKMYERSVQSPKVDAELYNGFFKKLTGRIAYSLREDFCGTFALSKEWIKLRKENTALGLDLDPACIEYGMKNHFTKLDPEQQSRIKILEKNVISTTKPESDMILANNFSFYIFKETDTLVKYFKKAYSSLRPGGAFILEMVGGPGFIEELVEEKVVKKSGKLWFTYYWDQQEFDPITRTGKWAIHFKPAKKKKMKDAFIYDWRLWTIPEVRAALEEAGFKTTKVLWEMPKGKKDYEYEIVEKGLNDDAWISYVAGIR